MNGVGDLWPDDLVHPIPSSPIAIMKEQALRLGKKTGNLVIGEVRPMMDNRWVNLVLELVMPLLDDYRFELLKVAYPAFQMYPLSIYVMGPEKTQVQSEQEFVEALRSILGSDKVRAVINSFVDMQRPRPVEIGAEEVVEY
jgi:hypothetical protein